ncbi:MAG: methyltransferase domain-containing protein [Desulfobacterales bacterium]|nr:MAG: methyltransferase domain-containing protein [Desulfobacterales bacterium]
MKKEVEVFGVTYDRYVLLQLHRVMTRDLHLQKVVEMPSHGAKAAGSLYSVGFGRAGCQVTLVNPEMEMMYGWHELGMEDKVETIFERNIYQTGFVNGQFDLAWNFVTWTELEDPASYLAEMKRISNNYVLLVTCNNFQPGYPWHRLIHKMFGFPWTHGEVKYNHITRVRKMFPQAGLKVLEYGAIDTPGWPDPSGPRDIRLHRNFSAPTQKPNWEVPIIQLVKTGNFPAWMKALGKWDMTFRKGVFKLPMSHLFYVLGAK